MTPFRDLPSEDQARLRAAYEDEMARQTTTCFMDEKISRFNAWLTPQGVSFSEDDLRPKTR
ncbi:hypothetical protein [Celeribacter sp. PS-C1]|uniref:hypothetical protein n=1 Tax=Celeribacter sp. PS-C1 TaxID=2820813 RepID=UPI001CA553D2|nr:hypothetical protein [Celeribacter sp. PS-C1]MBW6419262.1 hypothetical protein [Celeribacter sp. PS-C1]